ncbi:hypothetical protein F4813DRAFT_389264 [Daldinia decipiens]|uniref:uncharacterized protein n=1 Tax=Daldinia decipiens TaxID=326647 RepID=UPI0020C5139B|nr:uncharacterized protein F4813DRAFT_389264 [Daldinia decipiens]KAI1658000.1 hypothetical protein F4813DRAFT_389264 [Daldinia decipiens]
MCSADLFLGLLAILFPPLPVWVKTGLCSADSIINVLLCVLGYLPGLIHAWYIISKFPESYEYEVVPQDSERAHVTYVFVQEPQPQARPQAHPKSASNAQPNYGATDNNHNASSSAGPSDAHDDEGNAPPTYAEAVKGDHKIQTHD